MESTFATIESTEKKSLHDLSSVHSANSIPYEILLRDYLSKNLLKNLTSHRDKREKQNQYEWDAVFQAKNTFTYAELADEMNSLFPTQFLSNNFNPKLVIKEKEWVFVEDKYNLKNCKLTYSQIEAKISRFCRAHLPADDLPKSFHVLLLVSKDDINFYKAYQSVYSFGSGSDQWEANFSIAKIEAIKVFGKYSEIEDFSPENVLSWYHSLRQANDKNFDDMNQTIADLSTQLKESKINEEKVREELKETNEKLSVLMKEFHILKEKFENKQNFEEEKISSEEVQWKMVQRKLLNMNKLKKMEEKKDKASKSF